MHEVPVKSRIIQNVYFSQEDGRLRICFRNGEERLFEDMSPANHGSCIFPTTRKAKSKSPPSPSWLV